MNEIFSIKRLAISPLAIAGFGEAMHRTAQALKPVVLAKVPTVAQRFRPRLKKPEPAKNSLHPPRYFAKGPRPIAYLLTESVESDQARPVPHDAHLMRSLCRGKGTLRQNGQGLVYLDVDNGFVSAMMPFLKARHLIQAPFFQTFGLGLGAHVPVISKRESDFHFLGPVKEIGKQFSFEIEGLYSMKPENWPGVEEVWFFKVRSEELSAFRRSHFLFSLPGGHSFHIAVAIRPSDPANREFTSLPTMRINPAYAIA